MIYLASVLALAAGALIALQFGVNAGLRGSLGAGSPLYATLASYVVGVLASLVCLLVVRPAPPVWTFLPPRGATARSSTPTCGAARRGTNRASL